MKEETTKKLMQKSLVHTSDGFVHRLMEKVRAMEKGEKPRSSPFRTVLLSTIALGVAVSLVLFELLDLPNNAMGYGRDTWRIPFFVITTLVLLYSIDHILKLRKMEKRR